MKTLGAFRKLTADLPDNTPMLTTVFDHQYRHPGCGVATVITLVDAGYVSFEPDYGDDPELYDLQTVQEVKDRRRLAVVVE